MYSKNGLIKEFEFLKDYNDNEYMFMFNENEWKKLCESMRRIYISENKCLKGYYDYHNINELEYAKNKIELYLILKDFAKKRKVRIPDCEKMEYYGYIQLNEEYDEGEDDYYKVIIQERKDNTLSYKSEKMNIYVSENEDKDEIYVSIKVSRKDYDVTYSTVYDEYETREIVNEFRMNCEKAYFEGGW